MLGDFEGPDYGSWTATGDFAGTTPHRGGDGRIGEQIVDTFFGNPNDGDQNIGSIVSPEFTIDRDFLDFEIAGGNHPEPGPGQTGGRTSSSTAQIVRTATGNDSGTLNWRAWDVKDLAGKRAHIEIVDRATGGWGHVLADHFVLSDIAAKIRSDETAVNLLVDGQVVRSTAGKESEALDWTSWDVSDLRGKDAQIQIVDRNSGGWGHVLADQFMFADAPAQTAEQRSSWVDYGKDFYAAVTWNDVPDGRRIAIGWMNNWNYAGAIPTDPWRSAMSVPRELALQTIDGQPRLVQRPVRELRSLRGGRSFTQHHRTIPQGTTTLPVRGKTLEIKADLRIGSAKQAGLKVRTGNGEETVIGYDAQTGELYVDRTRSGRVDFSRDFPGVQRAPLAARHGKVRLRILVDWSSVEVFADGGRRVITDQVFPERHQRRGRAVRRRRQRHAGLAEGPAPALQLDDRPPQRLGQPTASPGRAAMPLAPGCTPVDDSAAGKRASPLPSNRRPLGTRCERQRRRPARFRNARRQQCGTAAPQALIAPVRRGSIRGTN